MLSFQISLPVAVILGLLVTYYREKLSWIYADDIFVHDEAVNELKMFSIAFIFEWMRLQM